MCDLVLYKRELSFPKKNNHIRINTRPSSLVDVLLLKCPKTKKVERNSEWRKEEAAARENKWWNARSKFTSNTFPPEILGIFVNGIPPCPPKSRMFRILNIVLLSAWRCSHFKTINRI